MQLKLAFLERAEVDDAQPMSTWKDIDPKAQKAALEALSRLVARMLAENLSKETIDE
jgi:hypothetical protein